LPRYVLLDRCTHGCSFPPFRRMKLLVRTYTREKVRLAAGLPHARARTGPSVAADRQNKRSHPLLRDLLHVCAVWYATKGKSRMLLVVPLRATTRVGAPTVPDRQKSTGKLPSTLAVGRVLYILTTASTHSTGPCGRVGAEQVKVPDCLDVVRHQSGSSACPRSCPTAPTPIAARLLRSCSSLHTH